MVYYKSTKNLTSVRWMADVGGVEDVILSTLTGDVIVKGKIDHEMEAVLILYKYASYLRYAIHWPTPSTTTTSTQSKCIYSTLCCCSSPPQQGEYLIVVYGMNIG